MAFAVFPSPSSFLLLPAPPSLPVAAFLYGCNFLSYLSGSNGVFDFYVFPPGPALSLAPRSHYQLGEFLCLGWPWLRFL